MKRKETAPKKEGEKIYEVGYHVVSSVSEEQIPAEAAKIKSYVEKEKAEIIQEEMPKLRPLAYEIKKSSEGSYKVFDKAYFGFIKFALSEDGNVENIDKAMQNNESVLRYIIVKTVRENTIYSPKITIFADRESKIRAPIKKPEEVEKPASMEEIDKSIDELLTEEVKA